ncbi:MAG: nucleotidyltransferase domain-containing protein [Candidatus Helarchaeota archaeon]
MREKIANEFHSLIKVYSKEHWDLFEKFRNITYNYIKILAKFDPIVHGSIARGDIHPKSDIDIMFLRPINEFLIINQLDHLPIERWIVQATPLSALKGLLVFQDINISFPLIPLYPREIDFYHFGGSLSADEIKQDKYIRVPGVNKKLLYISPTENGHKEYRITFENASTISRNLGINIETVLERIRVLERRDRVGRTGIFLKRILRPEESFGEVLEQIKNTNPASRRRIIRKKI